MGVTLTPRGRRVIKDDLNLILILMELSAWDVFLDGVLEETMKREQF